MAPTEAKRKRAEDIHGDKIVSKPHKRVRSDHVSLSSINHEAAAQIRDSNTSRADGIANITTKDIFTQLTGSGVPKPSGKETFGIQVNSEAGLTSRPKQSIVADAHDSSADEAPSLSLQRSKPEFTNIPKTLRVKKATKRKQASGQTSDSSADQVPVGKSSKVGTSKKTAQKQKVSSSEPSSLGESNVSITDPTNVVINATSKVDLLAPSSPSSEEALGERERLENEEEDEDEEEVGDDDDGEDDDEDDPDSGADSDSSIESASNDEPHRDSKNKETFKADNPSAFASSMAGILGYKLTRTQRANPILARSADAKEAEKTLLDMKLEKKAKAEIKKEKFKKGGMGSDPNAKPKRIHGDGANDLIKNVLGIDEPLEPQEVFAYQQHEKELRKMAQKGVVKMFNAFTSVRERAMEAQGLGGSRAKKEEKATEMSKEGWLEYVGQGGKGKS